MKEFGIDEANMFEFWDVSNNGCCKLLMTLNVTLLFCDKACACYLYSIKLNYINVVNFIVALFDMQLCINGRVFL